MPAPRTEILSVVRAGGGVQLRPVPVLCGIAIAGSWFAVCLALIPWAQ